ncbi:helix-turn-helix transcriptional regulator [Streptomyces poonensis]|uniref:WYL domain-containing protein n=1 Tax=Streptomyces poonensis TaxID=68255 RepID=A0A918UH66_9ACTN|nr:WYL domain-containing protein [Streptomyces poonensis]GGZ07484.1 WYL domain-containing protein [Streptomyces poonensis]
MVGKPARPANAIDQTRRMLSLVTYLRERPGARVEDVARAFGISEDELISDLDVLPLCGTSFRGGDLLDIDTDGERIWWHNPAALAAEAAEPLRLAADEATALLVAARAVATLPGLREGDRQALLRATAKVETAAGEAAGASSRLSVTFESEGGVFADVDRAISERRRLWIRYYSPARDELTEREIDPIRLVSVGHTYVEAWCRRSEARRTFRLDRVAEIKILDEPSAPPEIELRDLSEALVQPAAEDPEVVVEVGPGGRWVAEYYPHDSAEELPDGGLRITLRTPDPASLRRLALRLGRDGRIVEPRDLADSARQAAREALAAYDGLEGAYDERGAVPGSSGLPYDAVAGPAHGGAGTADTVGSAGPAGPVGPADGSGEPRSSYDGPKPVYGTARAVSAAAPPAVQDRLYDRQEQGL